MSVKFTLLAFGRKITTKPIHIQIILYVLQHIFEVLFDFDGEMTEISVKIK